MICPAKDVPPPSTGCALDPQASGGASVAALAAMGAILLAARRRRGPRP
jgi:MYXO-CTERM domain-containing protein